MKRAVLIGVAVALLAGGAQAALQSDSGRELPGMPKAVDPILERLPSELPRAAEGRWTTFFEDLSAERIEAEVGRPALAALGAAERAYGSNDFPGTLRRLYPLLAEQPDLPPALLVLGTTYFRLRRYGDTILCLERFLDVAPGQVWRTQVLGHSYYSLGRYAQAREHYGAVIEVLPDSPEAVRGLALSEMRLGDFERALELLARVVELDPQNWEALAWRAQILTDEGELEAALADAERARDLARHEPRPWFLLKNIYWELGRDDEAEEVELHWRELDALTQELRSARGLQLFRPRDFDLARQVAELSARVGDVNGTRAALDRVVANTPSGTRRVDVYVYALDLLWKLEDREGAESAALALARDCAEEPSAWRRLELYYAQTAQRELQVEAGERFRRLNDQQR